MPTHPVFYTNLRDLLHAANRHGVTRAMYKFDLVAAKEGGYTLFLLVQFCQPTTSDDVVQWVHTWAAAAPVGGDQQLARYLGDKIEALVESAGVRSLVCAYVPVSHVSYGGSLPDEVTSWAREYEEASTADTKEDAQVDGTDNVRLPVELGNQSDVEAPVREAADPDN